MVSWQGQSLLEPELHHTHSGGFGCLSVGGDWEHSTGTCQGEQESHMGHLGSAEKHRVPVGGEAVTEHPESQNVWSFPLVEHQGAGVQKPEVAHLWVASPVPGAQSRYTVAHCSLDVPEKGAEPTG